MQDPSSMNLAFAGEEQEEFPIALGPAYEGDQQNLFNLWKENGEDFQKVQAAPYPTAPNASNKNIMSGVCMHVHE